MLYKHIYHSVLHSTLSKLARAVCMHNNCLLLLLPAMHSYACTTWLCCKHNSLLTL
jgi:hypothetical protein